MSNVRLESLRKITELKNRLTQQANWRYSESMRDLEQEQQKLQAMLQAQDRAMADLHTLTVEGATATELHSWMQYMLTQRSLIESQNHLIEEKKTACTEKRDEMTDCYLEEQKWVKLKGRRVEEHRAILNKLGQEALDEIAVTGHYRMKG